MRRGEVYTKTLYVCNRCGKSMETWIPHAERYIFACKDMPPGWVGIYQKHGAGPTTVCPSCFDKKTDKLVVRE